MKQHQQMVAALGRRISGVLLLRFAVGAMAVWLFIWGTAVLAARVGWQVDRLPLAWGALGLLGAIVIAAVLARRRRPTDRQLHALIDRQAHAGGLVMADQEVDVGEWRQRIAAAELPTVQWRGRKTRAMAWAGVAYVAVTFALPDQFTAMNLNPQLDIRDEVALLEDQIQTLEKERVIESEEAASMTDMLKEVEKQARGADPTKTWEALDHMAERIKREAEQAAEQAINDTERMNHIAAMSEALSQAGEQLSPEAMAGAMQQLHQQMRDAAEASPRAKDALDAELQKKIEQGTKPESHFKFDVAKLSRLQEQVQDLEHLQSMDPKDLSPADALKLANLMRQVNQMTEQELMQLAALEAASLALREMGINAIAEVDTEANVRFFQPQAALTFDQARQPDIGATHAIRVREQGLTEQFAETMLIDADPFQIPAGIFEGEALALTHNAEGKLIVYVGKPSTPVEFDKLAALEGEHIIITAGAQSPRLYGPDEVDEFDAASLAQAGANAQQCMVSRAVMMRNMANARMIDPQALQRLQQMAEGNGEAAAALAQFLSDQGGQMSPGNLQAVLQSMMQPGRGGNSRGPGPAPMTWNDPSNLENASFKEQVLPPASMGSLRDAINMGTSISAPELADPNATATSGALSGAAAGGGSAHTQTILPRHRAAIERYFERD